MIELTLLFFSYVSFLATGLIRMPTTKVSEGAILNKWFHNRMIRRNQNVLMAVTGSTGSGKSYLCIRMAELWYRFFFKIPFDVSVHVCFSIGQVMKLLASKKLKRGSIIILEEAGANFGSLDFQNRVSKLFNYVLQSFRSMNLLLIMNLPYLSMLNKSARLLIHARMVTSGIDYQEKKSTSKAYFRQVNQSSGKIYDKFLRIKLTSPQSPKGKTVVVKKFQYSLPSPELIDVYEQKKLQFVTSLNDSFVKELEEIDKENNMKSARKDLTPRQQDIYEQILEGRRAEDIAKDLGCTPQNVYESLKHVKKKGYDWKKTAKSLRKASSQALKHEEGTV